VAHRKNPTGEPSARNDGAHGRAAYRHFDAKASV
jgi:hypothetical protein